MSSPDSTLHDQRFPGESQEYRRARDELLRAEMQLREQTARIAAQRRGLPLGGEVPEDYVFTEWDASSGAARQVRLSELFGQKDTLFLYSFMIVPREQGLSFEGPCPSCTSIIDAVDGELPHITQRMAFAVSTKAPIERFREHAASRGWRHARLLSSADSGYNRDYGAEDADGGQWPLATVFRRREGKIHHFWSSELWFAPREDGQGPRHVDFMWPVWAVLDRTPEGRDPDWVPELAYR
jgi:predicted dithiol-disulfide oxidoreductase (DUF899 family)